VGVGWSGTVDDLQKSEMIASLVPSVVAGVVWFIAAPYATPQS
jgi:hypothetical protein